jgi:hypothetical protein
MESLINIRPGGSLCPSPVQLSASGFLGGWSALMLGTNQRFGQRSGNASGSYRHTLYCVICIWVQRVRSPIGESVPVLVLPLLFLGICGPEVYIFIVRHRPAIITHSLLHLTATLGDHGAALSASPILWRPMTAPPGWIPRFRGPSAVSPRSELIGLRLLWSRVMLSPDFGICLTSILPISRSDFGGVNAESAR